MDSADISINQCGGTLVQVNGRTCERYASCKDLAEKRRIDKRILLRARKENPPGIKVKGNVFWEEFQPWLAQNYDRLFREVNEEQEPEEDIDRDLERQKLREQIRELRLKNGEKEKDIRNAFLNVARDVRNKWGEKLRQKLEYEYPAKCKGMSELELREVGKRLCDELLGILSTPVSQWERNE
jgi:hypothetical protein